MLKKNNPRIYVMKHKQRLYKYAQSHYYSLSTYFGHSCDHLRGALYNICTINCTKGMIKPLDVTVDHPGVQSTEYWAWRYNLERVRSFKCQVSGAGQRTVKFKCPLQDTFCPSGVKDVMLVHAGH
jgi:hypothetical protein